MTTCSGGYGPMNHTQQKNGKPFYAAYCHTHHWQGKGRTTREAARDDLIAHKHIAKNYTTNHSNGMFRSRY